MIYTYTGLNQTDTKSWSDAVSQTTSLEGMSVILYILCVALTKAEKYSKFKILFKLLK